MRERSIFVRAAVAASLMVGAAGVADAAMVVPVSATASSAFAAYPASDAIDQDAGSDVSDWAAVGEGAGAFLNVDLGAVFTLSSIDGVDRVTSGSGNNQFVGGLFDFTTSYSVQAYTDATFTTTLGSALTFTKTAPVAPSSPSDFAFSGSLNGLTAQYLRYTVVATNGVNPGLSNLTFTTVPEPGSWALMIGGFGLVGGTLRRRGRATLATA